ncbi:MAG: M16 family metallopeptidase, partial [Alphaproteobacteria bacterium]
MTRKMTVLPNGLQIVTDTMDEVDTVSLGIWVDIGAMYEPAEINGISHLLEHMAFKGTTNRTACQIAEEIENVGGYI